MFVRTNGNIISERTTQFLEFFVHIIRNFITLKPIEK